ncbi:SCO1664 family protein [Rhodococcus sp. IEGM 1408]|uniref:SCO1664 family protein n=1 Tax=Rhodococcus sp. IEGM 1408 TaxID=3082220 RepID=UPI002952D7C9|nr:SCO1664 family protein [Rhodococcus sp. IEGM 1408]MDV8000216.1 SCO1664 family protein [Rhodococcus sp. IEGM 1408]
MTARPPGPELTVLHRIPSGSNAVYRCVDGEGSHWVYKPSAGERPLMDFPDGSLAAREIAAYTVSVALGWDLIPETVAAFGPGGPGMAQRWIDEPERDESTGHDPVDVHPVDALPAGRVAVLRGEGSRGESVVVAHALDDRLRRIALFDLVVNNADRKGGHVLVDTSGVIWAIDHGLSFHAHPKLRTVLWGWAGQPLSPEDLAALTGLGGDLAGDGALRETLSDLLSPVEVAALCARVTELVDDEVFPSPGPGYPLPWPLF